MLTEVMRFYGLARPPIDAGFFETEHHAQVSRDIRAAIVDGRLIALTAITGCMCILMGLLAEIIMRTYYEAQGKSVYLIGETRNLKKVA